MTKSPSRRLPVLLAALVLPLFALTLTGCDPECVDKFDCRDKAKDGEEMVCVDNFCRVDDGTGGEDAGEEPDAGGGGGGDEDGGFDAGTEDAGVDDAGVDDAGVEDAGVEDAGVEDAGFNGDAGVFTFNVRMNAGQLVPEQADDPDYTNGAFGGTLNMNRMDDGGYSLFYAFTVTSPVTNTEAPAQSWVRAAPAGRNGETNIITFTPARGNPPTNIIANGTVTLTFAQANGMRNGNWYAQYNATPIAGTPQPRLRGQVVFPGEWLYVANMSGLEEVPPITDSARGGGHVIVTSNGTPYRYSFGWDALDGGASGAHIHLGDAGQTGGVIVDLTPGFLPDGGGTRGTIDPAMLPHDALDGGRTYVNVHSPAHPGGEVRGQLLYEPSNL